MIPPGLGRYLGNGSSASINPTITSGATANNPENSVLAHALTADQTVTWSIVGGVDLAHFEISGSTLRWASNGTKNYEAPGDTGANNTYVVTVRALNTMSLGYTEQSITITVTDVSENQAPTDIALTAIVPSGSVTFDSGNKPTSITLSNGDLTATKNGAGNHYQPVNTTIDAGEIRYWEIQVVLQGGGASYLGLAPVGGDNDSFTVATIAGGVALRSNGAIWKSGAQAVAADAALAWTTGDVLMFCYDEAAGKLYLGKNGTWKNDPASGTGTTTMTAGTDLIPSVSPNSATDGVTIRTTALTLAYSIPAGATALDGTNIWVSGMTVREDTPVSTALFTISGTDPDTGESATLTFSEVADPGNKFTVSGTTVTLSGALDYETATSHSLTIRATDVHGATYDEVFTILVGDVAG